MKEHPKFDAEEAIRKINKRNADGILTGVGEKERMAEEQIKQKEDAKEKIDILVNISGKGADEDYIVNEFEEIIKKYPELTKSIKKSLENKLKEVKKQSKDNPKILYLSRLLQHISSKIEN